MVARTAQFMDGIRKEIASSGGRSAVILADCTDQASLEKGLSEALGHVSAEMPLQAVVYNAAARIESPFLKLTSKHLETSYKLNQLAPWLILQRTLPIMEKQGFGSVLVTGATASIRGNANFTAFASTKGALRAFCQSLAKEMGPRGVHVAHFIIDGGVANSRIRHVRKDIPWDKLGASMDPESIADEYWHVHKQHFSSWTFEIDLRPFSEKF
ncbi:putative short chain dehydrogenase [Hyaloraphidium curvatum]|nr:putative short chain dehydrogenase [Hyaloraphidium curvatum]